MEINKYINRLQQLDQLIRQKCTGTPKQLAGKLNLSERQTYICIEEMKDLGLPISYNRNRQTYYYTEPMKLSVNISLISLSTNESIEIEGGVFLYSFICNCNKIAV
jgi:predicted DNA-binding transcriptional regulator YafY